MRPAYSGGFNHPDLAAKYGLDRTYILEVPAGTDTETMAAAFAQLPDVEIATVDTIGGVADAPPQFIPNDPSFNVQYGMHNTGQAIQNVSGVPDADIDAPEAWAIHTGDLGTVTIAIIDSGVNSHAEYGTNFPSLPSGRIVQGQNTNNPTTPQVTSDGCPHGTHVTGIAAASGNNGIGVAGVTWGAYIMPVRVLNGCNGAISQLADGIHWAADNGADVGNVSLQYPNITIYEYNLLRDAISFARDAGMLLIAAAGNNEVNGQVPPGVVAYPARMPNVIGVSATNNDDVFCSTISASVCTFRSVYGNEVDVCAPGNLVYSTWTVNSVGTYTYLSGTSMATPHVSGLAALIKSYNIDLTVDELEYILISTVDDKGPVGWDNQYGFGRINAYRALRMAGAWPVVVSGSEPPSGAIDARKPTNRDGSGVYGWQSADLSFVLYSVPQTPEDFEITKQGGVAGAPMVSSVTDLGANHALVEWGAALEPKTWTALTHRPSAVAVRLGYLPGDVDASSWMDSADVTALLNELKAATATRPLWSVDIDRSGLPTAADLLEVVDLYNGAEGYEPYFGVELPH